MLYNCYSQIEFDWWRCQIHWYFHMRSSILIENIECECPHYMLRFEKIMFGMKLCGPQEEVPVLTALRIRVHRNNMVTSKRSDGRNPYGLSGIFSQWCCLNYDVSIRGNNYSLNRNKTQTFWSCMASGTQEIGHNRQPWPIQLVRGLRFVQESISVRRKQQAVWIVD